jgi:hypothetical protein
MSDPGQYVMSKRMKIRSVSATITLYATSPTFVSVWECSCGDTCVKPIPGLSPGSTNELGELDFRAHCDRMHK